MQEFKMVHGQKDPLLKLEELARKNAHLQGQKQAIPLVRRNRLTDKASVDAISRIGLSFSKFQELALYNAQVGYFETLVDFKDEMPLPTGGLSPLLGMCFAEQIFSAYVLQTQPFAPNPTFLGLGAGRGVLDFDIIRYFTSKYEFPDYAAHVAAIKDRATFIVSDRTQKSLELLTRELAPLTSADGLGSRIRIEQIDATDFNLGNKPFGIVYASELVDNMLTEPVVKVDGKLYAVKVLAYIRGKNNFASDSKHLQSKLNMPVGFISREEVENTSVSQKTDSLKFLPVFIPLECDEKLAAYTSSLQTFNNIDREDFSGIYPVHIGLKGLFKSIRKSFEHGVVVLTDYHSCEGGYHNWNMAVNQFGIYQTGREDIDLQIDPEQVINVANSHGMSLLGHSNLGAFIQTAMPLMKLFDSSDFQRWADVNGQQLSPLIPESLILYYELTTQLVLKGYDIVSLGF